MLFSASWEEHPDVETVKWIQARNKEQEDTHDFSLSEDEEQGDSSEMKSQASDVESKEGSESEEEEELASSSVNKFGVLSADI